MKRKGSDNGGGTAPVFVAAVRPDAGGQGEAGAAPSLSAELDASPPARKACGKVPFAPRF